MLKVKGLSVIHYLIMFPMIQRQRCHALPHRCRLANRNPQTAPESFVPLHISSIYFVTMSLPPSAYHHDYLNLFYR
jgi:hypothetical protein